MTKMWKTFPSFLEGIKAIRTVSESVWMVLYGVTPTTGGDWMDFHRAVLGHLAQGVVFSDSVNEAPDLVVGKNCVAYTTQSRKVSFGWEKYLNDSGDAPSGKWGFWISPKDGEFRDGSTLQAALLAAGWEL